ncbi:MAG: UDP-N-acetylglucosamine--N-acetylmuramyl-(pentapeptide) pyrophosphoryl-undecaprenol N-acetylglucosamine transferase [Patescibacteria group bacterium]
MKLLITGGHVTPALAVIDELQRSNKSVQILFVGRRYTSEKSREETLEYKEIKARKIQFIHLKTGRLTRVLSVATIFNLLKVPAGFFQAVRIIRKYKPDRVLSFGGYLALPIAVVASAMNIPVYTHEQTIQPGLSNRIIARFARKVLVSFEDSKQYFPKRRVVVSGNPVREQTLTIQKKPFTIKKTSPVIYITGGSLGSHSINALIEEILPELLEQYIVIHQVGNVKEYNDFRRLEKYKKILPVELQKRYFLKEHMATDELGYIFSVSDLIIGRSGANTFFELVRLKKPAIFIPLPWSGHNEQQKQADLYKTWGVGEVFNQEGSSKELLTLVHSTIESLDKYQKNFNHTQLTYAKDAVSTIIKTIIGQ